MTRQVSQVATQAAPVKGLNAFDSVVGMEEGYALVLKNWYAQPYGCQLRRGYVVHKEVDGVVESLLPHNRLTPKLFAVANDAGACTLYDVTTPNGGALALYFGLSNARWNSINFPNAAGVNMIAVNGKDDPFWFQANGNIARISAGDGTTPNTIANVDPKNFTQVYAHQKRLWFVEKDSTAAWYLPPDQLYGVATFFDFGPLMTRGGYLTQIITWTLDDGNGSEDHLAAITTEGEVLVYSGLDPDGVDTWALVGVFYAGAPMGPRAATRFGGDILFITIHGIVLMSQLLQSTKVNPSQDNIGQKVQQLLSTAATTYRNEFGWEPFIFPSANMIVVNIPFSSTKSAQLVLNFITKSWSEFIGYEARCWALHQQLPFYGGFGGVFRAWEGHTDGAVIDPHGEVTPGEPVRGEAQSAFSFFGSPGQNKHFKMVRPTILSQGYFRASIAVNTDFKFDSPVYPTSFPTPEFGKWDEDKWDAAVWSGGLTTYKSWNSVTGIGSAAAIRVLVVSDAETYWPVTDWLIETGGVM